MPSHVRSAPFPNLVAPAWLVAVGLLLLAGCGGPVYHSHVINSPEYRGLKAYQKPYVVNGQRYDPLRSGEGFVQTGVASWYGPDFHGKKTSNGETYNMYAMTAAHKTLPLGVYVRVTNTANGKQATVRVNDRGPFVKGRIIDLSYAAAKALGVVGPGTAPVRIEALGYQETGTKGQVAYRQPASYDAGHFTVQVGAFTVAANANRLAGQLRARYGASSIQQGNVGGRLFYRVRAGNYTSLEAAQAAKGQFEAAGYPEQFRGGDGVGKGERENGRCHSRQPVSADRPGGLFFAHPRKSTSVERAANSQRVFAGDMGVDHGGAQVGMSKQVLDGTDVGAPFQKVGGEGMT